jgi:basic membrane protein A
MLLACEVTDTGGVDDRSFNQSAWEGVLEAVADFPDNITGEFLESQDAADYEPNVQALLDQDCDLIILTGFLFIDAAFAIAPENPDRKFAIVDVGGLEVPNLRELTFQTDEASFLAGYVAAGATKTGVLGTYGGIAIPSVTIFMDGFVQGAEHYNTVNGTSVEVKGWDVENQTGLFTEDFGAVDIGQQLSASLLDEGADIVMPVGGAIGLGLCAEISQRGTGDLYHIGVDVDWNLSAAAECGDFTFTNVLKAINEAIYNTIVNVLTIDALGNPYIGTLINNGVDITKTGAWSEVVSADLEAEVDALKAAIIAAGSLADFVAGLEDA